MANETLEQLGNALEAAQQNQPVNGIGMRWGGFRSLYRIGKEIDIE